jgi:leucyl-tRNA synthetase
LDRKKYFSNEKTIKNVGLSIDWDLEISTCDENITNISKNYLLIFIILGLISRKENYVNWDPVEETVLANEQVVDGKGWRSGALVERKKILNGFLILNYLKKNY